MSDNNIYNWGDAASIIKDAIIRSRYQAATLVNRELLSLYYAVGKFVSENSRDGYWGKGAIKRISNALQKELPGLRGFSESSIRMMRLFYEGWQTVFLNHQLSTDDLSGCNRNLNHQSATDDLIAAAKIVNHSSITDDLPGIRHSSNDKMQIIPYFENDIDLSLLSKHISSFDSPEFFVTSFYKVGFTHHSERVVVRLKHY